MTTIKSTTNEVLPPLVVTVCGGGNAAHVFAGLIGSNATVTLPPDVLLPTLSSGSSNGNKRRVVVQLFSLYKDEAARFRAGHDRSSDTEDVGVTIACNMRTIKRSMVRDSDGAAAATANSHENCLPCPVTITGRVARFSRRPADVIPQTDILIMSLPAFAHEQYLRAVAPHLRPRTLIGAFPGAGGFDVCCRAALGASLFDSITVLVCETLPWACRTTAYGRRAELCGVKAIVDIACRPRAAASTSIELLQSLFDVNGRRVVEMSKCQPQARPNSIVRFNACARMIGGIGDSGGASILAATIMNINSVWHPPITVALLRPLFRAATVMGYRDDYSDDDVGKADDSGHKTTPKPTPPLDAAGRDTSNDNDDDDDTDGGDAAGAVVTFPKPPLFYEGVTPATGQLLTRVSKEQLAICDAITAAYPHVNLSIVQPLYDWVTRAYDGLITDARTVDRAIATNRAYAGLVYPMASSTLDCCQDDGAGGAVLTGCGHCHERTSKPHRDDVHDHARMRAQHRQRVDYTHRYFSEDVPFGLVVTRGFAELAGVHTPAMDGIIRFVQRRLGREFLVPTVDIVAECDERNVGSSTATSHRAAAARTVLARHTAAFGTDRRRWPRYLLCGRDVFAVDASSDGSGVTAARCRAPQHYGYTSLKQYIDVFEPLPSLASKL